MANTDKNGNWIDPIGVAVPRRYVKPLDRNRDAMVERLFKKAMAIRDRIKKFRDEIDEEVEKFLDTAAAEAGVPRNDGGNYTFTGFSGDKRFQVKIKHYIDFDERLTMAKQLVDQCLIKWSDKSDARIRVLILDAFKTDQKGRVDKQKILGLRKHNFPDPEWKKAMGLISDAVTILSSKAYILFQVRPNPSADWETIRLDLAAYAGG